MHCVKGRPACGRGKGILKRAWLLSASIAAALAILPPAAGAVTTTLGSPLMGFTFGGIECAQACTLAQKTLSGATLTSPVDGVIVRWRLFGGSSSHSYRLRVMTPHGATQFEGAGTSADAVPASPALTTFAAALPVHAGQAIGIDLQGGGRIGSRNVASGFLDFQPPLGEGATATGILAGNPAELGFNADVQPAPTIAAVTPGTGPLSGGNAVIVEGADFEGASAVSFGGVPAKRYTVDSESRITAFAPAGARPEAVSVSVTTLAGTVTLDSEYTYLAPEPIGEERPPGPGPGPGPGGEPHRCLVPKLRGGRLKAAKKKLSRAGCGLGKVKRRPGVTARTGRVVRQRPRAGAAVPAGTRVALTLGP